MPVDGCFCLSGARRRSLLRFAFESERRPAKIGHVRDDSEDTSEGFEKGPRRVDQVLQVQPAQRVYQILGSGEFPNLR